MKLIVLAALVAVAVGARLEHLERAYLPPDNGSQGSSGFQNPSNFGQNPNGQTNGPSQSPNGSQGSSGSQGSNGGSATSNQYLPPDQGPSGSSNGNFAGSFRPVPGFGTQGSQYTPQFGSGNRQNQAAQSSNYQNPPQQAFDEETGYHY